jgi:hypothetical protein
MRSGPMNKCCICNEPIERQLAPDGTVAWDKGHNPAPVMDGDDDRCCGQCNSTVVLPERLKLAGIDPDTVRVVTGHQRLRLLDDGLIGNPWSKDEKPRRSKPFIDDGTTEPPGAPLEGE